MARKGRLLTSQFIGMMRRGGARRYSILAIALVVGLLVGMTSVGVDLDRGLSVWRARLHTRSATGHFAFIEIDSRSLNAFRSWPWPRGRYAAAIDALRRAGAQTIAFDIDFSAPSMPDQDAVLARAIAGSAVPIVLPTFRQSSSQASALFVENLPIPILRNRAELAAVNIYADPDGLVRSYPYGIVTAGLPRPSTGAMLAGITGRSGASFPIDLSLDPGSIPHLSFVDLLDGRFPPTKLKDCNVLIGASAIELGDHYPVPGHGVIPGPMIQLLAAETLLQNSAPVDHGFFLPLLLAVGTIMVASRGGAACKSLVPVAGGLAILLLPLACEWAKIGTFTVVPAFTTLVSGVITDVLYSALHSAREARHFDADSGLPNVRSLQQQLNNNLSATAVVLRMANYGDVASVLGKVITAEFIICVAERLSRAGDTPVHRIDDSSLAWLLLSSDQEEQMQRIDAAAAMLRAPFQIAGRCIELVHGFGLAMGGGPDTLNKATNAASRSVSRLVRWTRYTTDMERESEWRIGLVTELNQAMIAGDIWVAYQPKFDIQLQTVTAAEALVRWQHPERGLISPDTFIPVLEGSGQIADLTLFVLERALADRNAWADQGVELNVAVNLSALLPSDPLFVQRLETVLARNADTVPYLTLEITESAAMVDPEQAICALDHLASLGLSLSIDDYGTGLSTLSYLKRLPAREIKIDKSFVLALETSRGDQAMVRSTIELAHELGFKVVAEGVENEKVLQILASFSCDMAQGWHIGRPMASADLPLMARDRVALTT